MRIDAYLRAWGCACSTPLTRTPHERSPHNRITAHTHTTTHPQTRGSPSPSSRLRGSACTCSYAHSCKPLDMHTHGKRYTHMPIHAHKSAYRHTCACAYTMSSPSARDDDTQVCASTIPAAPHTRRTQTTQQHALTNIVVCVPSVLGRSLALARAVVASATRGR